MFNKSISLKLASIEDSSVLAGIRRLIHLIPTDGDVGQILESVGHVNHHSGADASPKMSPRYFFLVLGPLRLPNPGVWLIA